MLREHCNISIPAGTTVNQKQCLGSFGLVFLGNCYVQVIWW